MKIAIDASPIEDSAKLAHRVRGTGFYISHLKKALLRYFSEDSYIFFSNASELTGAVDVVHYPYFEPFFLTLPIFGESKKVVTVHDLTPLVFPEHFKTGLRGKFRWQIQKIALRNADAIITDSISSKKDIISFAGIESSKIDVVYLAAGEDFKVVNSPNSKTEDLYKKYNLPKKFVLYVGDVTWNKNLPRLIEAMNKVNLPLVLVGQALVNNSADLENPWNSDLAKTMKLSEGNKNIIRLGFVSSEELVLLYNIATVFAMPSLYEGFGLPILEAMSCGCPVVTSNKGSIPEIAQDAAFYVDAYSVDSIARGVEEVFGSDQLQANLSKKGLKQASKFGWEKTARETMAVYRKLITR